VEFIRQAFGSYIERLYPSLAYELSVVRSEPILSPRQGPYGDSTRWSGGLRISSQVSGQGRLGPSATLGVNEGGASKAVVAGECTRGTGGAVVAGPRTVGPHVAARNSLKAACGERARLCPGPRSGIVIMPWAIVLLARWYASSKSDLGLE